MAREKISNPLSKLLCAWLIGFAIYTPLLCVPPIMHIIAEELLLNYAQLGLVFSVPLMMLAAFAIPSGTLADRIGIRKAVSIGLIIIIVGSLLRGISVDFATLLSFTCLYGAGLGLIYPNVPKLVGSWFPPQKIGLATSIYAMGVGIGSALPLAITLPVIFPIGNTFREVFYIWTIPALIAVVTWWIVTKQSLSSTVQIKQISDQNESSYRIWTNRTLWLVSILFFISDFIFYNLVGWTPELLVIKGAPQDLAALMTSVELWAGLPILLVVPWVSDKIGLRRPFICGSFIFLALASLSAIYTPLSLAWFVVVALGIAPGVQFAMILALPAELVPAEGVGRASGMMLCIGYIGGLMGPWIAGYILDLTGNLNLDLAVLIGLAIAGTYIAIRLPETGPRVRLRKR